MQIVVKYNKGVKGFLTHYAHIFQMTQNGNSIYISLEPSLFPSAPALTIPSSSSTFNTEIKVKEEEDLETIENNYIQLLLNKIAESSSKSVPYSILLGIPAKVS